MEPYRAFVGLEGLSVGRLVSSETERLIMALYEHIYLVRQDVTAPQVEALTETLKTLIAQQGGSVSKVEAWGLKSLAFRIKKNRKAYFTLMNITAPSAAIVELERQLSLNEDVIRFITLRVDEHEAGPSAMLRKRDDGDREERGGGAVRAAIAPIVGIVRIAAIVPIVPVARVKTLRLEPTDVDRPPPSLLPPPQVLPVHRPERAEDRLQGHAPALALHLRARQDRALAHHRGLRGQTARTRPGDQARALPRPAALRHPLTQSRARQARPIENTPARANPARGELDGAAPPTPP